MLSPLFDTYQKTEMFSLGMLIISSYFNCSYLTRKKIINC